MYRIIGSNWIMDGEAGSESNIAIVQGDRRDRCNELIRRANAFPALLAACEEFSAAVATSGKLVGYNSAPFDKFRAAVAKAKEAP